MIDLDLILSLIDDYLKSLSPEDLRYQQIIVNEKFSYAFSDDELRRLNKFARHHTCKDVFISKYLVNDLCVVNQNKRPLKDYFIYNLGE